MHDVVYFKVVVFYYLCLQRLHSGQKVLAVFHCPLWIPLTYMDSIKEVFFENKASVLAKVLHYASVAAMENFLTLINYQEVTKTLNQKKKKEK